jgi:pimeloyl-ACP methyl ester carboxylesterase
MTAGMMRKAPAWLARPQSAEATGERIAAALAAGHQELQWGGGERLLIHLQRFAPRLLAQGLSTQRRRLAHVMTPEPVEYAPPAHHWEAQLAAVRAAHPVQTYAISGHSWRFVDAGGGDNVLLLLPGALGEADTSFQYILALQDTRRVLSLGYPATLDRLLPLLDSLDDLLERLGVRQAHVVGGSYSGLVAQYLAARRPERVAALLLANTGAPGMAAARRWQAAAAACDRLPEGWLQRIMQASITRFLPGSSPVQAFWRSYFAATLPHWRKEAVVARLRLLAEMQTNDTARRVRRSPYAGPVLIVDAAADRLVGTRERQALRALYPQAQHVRFDGKGHVASLDEAEAYIRIYREFLCSLPTHGEN